MGHEWDIGDWAELHGSRYLVYMVDKEFVFGVRHSGTASWRHVSEAKHLPGCTGWDWEPTEIVNPIEPPPGYRILGREEVLQAGDICVEIGLSGRNTDWRDCGTLCVGHRAGFRIDSYGAVCFARKIETEPVAHEWKFGDWGTSHRGIVRFVTYNKNRSRDPLCFLTNDGLFWQLEEKQVTYLPGCTGFDWTPEDPKKPIEPRYRPFANAAEFAQLGYKWVMNWSGDNPSYRKMITEFDDDGAWEGDDCISWEDMAMRYRFEDGTPFGVLETKE